MLDDDPRCSRPSCGSVPNGFYDLVICGKACGMSIKHGICLFDLQNLLTFANIRIQGNSLDIRDGILYLNMPLRHDHRVAS